MIVFFNPRSTSPGKEPLPLSLLSLAAVVGDRFAWALVDGNFAVDPVADIVALATQHGADRPTLLAVTVMPGPQLLQAVPVCKAVRARRPELPIVWGGYFPTHHADTVLGAPYVDFVVRGQGEVAFRRLVETLADGGSLDAIPNLSWKRGATIVHNPVGPLVPLDDLPEWPYERLAMDRYLHATYLGRRTVAHNSSFGCPFACNFCAVVAMAHRRWVAQSAPRLAGIVQHLAATYGVDAVQMHDMDFFIAEQRAAEFATRIAPLGLSWWALGRVDILAGYADRTWRALKRSGLRMIFSGAESGSTDVLAAMNKGGTASPELTLELARRLRDYGIVPEFSFVLGVPPDPMANVRETIEFVRRVKRINPEAEIVLYVYTPVPLDGRLYDEARRLGFAFPDTLDEWVSERWARLALRRGDGIQWMDGAVRRQVRNFERVLNAFYPTVTDRRLTPLKRAILRAASGWRYALRFYNAPLELRALHRLMQYQRPETTGF
jgi:anaerobic magnesium-protoporphyrin IX monomethyl ester cyclase